MNGLMTDRYELTMLSAFLEDGSADTPAVFECFSRRLPKGRRYGVVAGLGRLLALLEDFRFDERELDYLLATDAITPRCADYLRTFSLRGVRIEAYREGELYFPYSPVLTVQGTLGQGVVLETLVLSVLNHDSAVASAAARMSVAAGTRPLIEMGSRRTHEQAAIASARAAYVAGFASTSNLAAGFLYGVPTVGTAAHAFTLAHATEKEAFASQVAAHGPGTTLLVDTYDVAQGIRTAVEVAGPELGAIRLDSGDLDEEARKARLLLDELGATRTRIVVTSDLDEYLITALAHAPIDGYGVGTRVVTGSGHPTAGFVYKLVEVAGRSVAKSSVGKISLGGRKTASRTATGEVVALDGSTPGRPLQVVAVDDGVVVHSPSLEEVRAHHLMARAELPAEALAVVDGEPALVARPPKTALIVVDMQVDFGLPSGSLYVHGAEELLAPINALIESADLVVYTQDHHPPVTPHFVTQGGIWPPHGVAGTPGAELLPGLLVRGEVVRKGADGRDGYSGFTVRDPASGETAPTVLEALLRKEDVDAVVVVGLAGDYCVGETAIDAAGLGFAVTMPLALTRFVGLEPGDEEAMIDRLRAAGVTVTGAATA